jgi:hypothetical protein
MAETSYRVVPRGSSGFDVEMDKADGRKTTIPGFRSEHEANAWIVQAKRLIRDAGPWTPLAPRKPVAKSASEAAEPPSVQPPSAQQQAEQTQAQDARNRASKRRSHGRTVRER